MHRTRALARQAMSARSFSTATPLASSARSFAAYFVRGGTSNGLVVREDALPASGRPASDVSAAAMAARAAAWAPVLAPAMGSPDAVAGRQLDGMGSGASSTSKVCVIAPPASDAERADRDVNFTFVQVGIRDGRLDLAGNCGNMISAVGPVAFDLGFGGAQHGDENGKNATAVVRIFNTNTGKTIRATFSVAGTPPRYAWRGDYAIDGVPGTQSRITLGFLRPAGAKTGAQSGLPTGNAVDRLSLPLLSPGDGEPATVQASLVDVSNPGVFVLGSALGLGDDVAAAARAIETDGVLKARVDHLRREGAVRMGMDAATESVPKIVVLFPPAGPDADIDIGCVALSMGQVHKAVPLTLALCLGAAARIPGTLAAQLVAARSTGSTRPTRSTGSTGPKDTIVIGHPSGRVDVGTTLDEADGTVLSAELHRTARVLMEGRVFY